MHVLFKIRLNHITQITDNLYWCLAVLGPYILISFKKCQQPSPPFLHLHFYFLVSVLFIFPSSPLLPPSPVFFFFFFFYSFLFFSHILLYSSSFSSSWSSSSSYNYYCCCCCYPHPPFLPTPCPPLPTLSYPPPFLPLPHFPPTLFTQVSDRHNFLELSLPKKITKRFFFLSLLPSLFFLTKSQEAQQAVTQPSIPTHAFDIGRGRTRRRSSQPMISWGAVWCMCVRARGKQSRSPIEVRERVNYDLNHTICWRVTQHLSCGLWRREAADVTLGISRNNFCT